MTDNHAFLDIDSGEALSREKRSPSGAQAVDELSTAAQAERALEMATSALQLAAAAVEASRYARMATSPATWRQYTSSWGSFTRWASDTAVSSLPASGEHVALYIAWRARTRQPATIAGDLAAIGAAHRAAGLDDPTKDAAVKLVLRGIRRSRGVAQRKKTPLVVESMRAVLATLDDRPRGRRDRAMLLLGWAGALRRRELVAIDQGDVEIVAEGLVIHVRRSKTDQVAAGAVLGLPRHADAQYDPVRAYCAWREVTGFDGGPVFRPITKYGSILPRRIGDREVARLVKRVAARAGLQGDYSGHSLRAGFATAAAAAGAGERQIMAQTRHRSLEVMRGYIRPASIWIENAAAVAAL